MNTQKKAAQTRFIVAVSLFAAALISALALTALGNRTDSYWVAKNALAPGVEISRDQVTLVQSAERGALRKEIAKMAQAISAVSQK